jgi:hypothetical protein
MDKQSLCFTTSLSSLFLFGHGTDLHGFYTRKLSNWFKEHIELIVIALRNNSFTSNLQV